MEKKPDLISPKLSLLPDKPGIYLWKNANGEIIYIGKAKSLKHRVRSYLSSSPKDIKTEQLVQHIADLEYYITPTEQDAFALEATLIKQHKPKYNILLKDDKRYPYVKITTTEPFPRILVTRDLVRDGSKYFGPYTDAKSLRITLRNFEWIFPIRNCSRIIPADKIKFKSACINYQLGKCTAPCIGKISLTEYRVLIKRLLNFFAGMHQDIISEMRNEMNQLSEDLKFEEAAKVRDRILAMDRIIKRSVVSSADLRDIDAIGFFQDDNIAVCVVLKIKGGLVINREEYPLSNVQDTPPDSILSAFLKLYYSDVEVLPEEILMQQVPAEFEELNEWLRNKLQIPQRGDKSKLVAMAKSNAFHLVEDQKLSHLRKTNRTVYPIQELKEKLALSKLPRKMVCMDISNIQGVDTVSSVVFFENGKPRKKFYRHFIIRGNDGQNDYAALQETLTRFVAEVAKDGSLKPDLIVIDGGKGQLAVCFEVLSESELSGTPIISLAKRAEEIFLPQRTDSIILPRSSSALRLLTALRDEAHRFAINFHRSRRSRRTLVSELESIPGIGEKTRFVLLKAFGSVDAVRMATLEQLVSTKGIGTKTAEAIYEYMHADQSVQSGQEAEVGLLTDKNKA